MMRQEQSFAVRLAILEAIRYTTDGQARLSLAEGDMPHVRSWFCSCLTRHFMAEQHL